MWQSISSKTECKEKISFEHTGEISLALKLMYITNNPEVALIAEKNGVDRIWVDLESEGKEERQRGQNSVKSNHTIKDIETIAPLLTKSEMLVRINPWSERSATEVDHVIQAGAELIMLPMWKSLDEVEQFIRCIDGRCKTVLLLETKEAVECLDDVLKIPGINEIHIGLNDLHLSYHLTFMFELVSNGMVEYLIEKIKKAGLPFGFGGIGKIGRTDLPIKAEMLVLEHYRLGSTRVILSQAFLGNTKWMDLKEVETAFCENMKDLREFEKYAATADKDVFIVNTKRLSDAVKNKVI